MQTLKTLARKAGIMMLAMLVTHTAVADTVTYFHNDISGSPLAATDASGALLWRENYKPYGEKLNQAAPSGSNKIGFHGKAYDDDTGLSYMGARYYDPVIGRFMGVDPVDFQQDNLHSFNRYTYVNNNPYKYVDPNGEYAFLIAPLVSLLTALSVTAIANSTSSSFGSGGDEGFNAAGSMNIPGSSIDGAANWSLGQVHNESDGGEDASETKDVTNRPSGFRKGTVQDAWDNAAEGSTPDSKACPTCGKDVHVAPGQGPRDWDVDHQPAWSHRDLTGKSRSEVLNDYNRGTRLECPHCNRSRGAGAP